MKPDQRFTMAVEDITTKPCTKCGKNKPLTEFYKHAERRDGLRADCKECVKNKSAKWRAENHEKAVASFSKWRSSNPDKVKADHAKWYAENRDKVIARSAVWAAENPDKVKAARVKYYSENKEKARFRGRISSHNRRSRVRENGGSLSKGLTERLFKLQRGKCACCGKPLGDNYHLDHIVPLALGGTNTDGNIQLLRSKCNLQKHARHPIDFMRQRGFLL